MLYTGKNRSVILVLLLTAVYFVIGLIGILNHEVWLDEAHHFLIAKDSVSLSDLVYNTRYEGHPLLWSLLVFVITRFTDDIFYMQLMNIAIMTTVCFLFLKHSRFKMMLNIVILCGYFFIYEYLVISRSYSLFLLALTLTFMNLKEQNKYWRLYLSLLFLPLTHVFGIIISIIICCLFLFKQLTISKVKPYVLFLIIAINLLILWSIKIPADHFLYHYDSDRFFSYKRLSKTASMFAKGLLPLPDITEPIKWNSNFFTNKLRLVGVLFGVGVFISALYFLRKNRQLLLLYFLPCAAVCLFMHVSPVVLSVRYCGILFILFIYILCFLFTTITNKKLSWFIISLCILQMIAGIIMYVTDLSRDFSNAKKVATYIRENNLSNKPLMVSNFSAAPAIACYLKKKIYYAETCEKSNYCKWNTWPFILTNEALTNEISKQVKPKDSIVLVLNQHYFHEDLHDTLVFRESALHYQLAKSFNNAMVNNENYLLFYIFYK